MSLTVISSERAPRVFTLYPSGSLDSNTYTILEQKVDFLIREGGARLITFDMAGVDYISSMGVRTVLRTKKELQRRGGAFAMMNMQPQIEKVFAIINALPSLRIFSSTEELDDYLAEMQRQTIQGEA